MHKYVIIKPYSGEIPDISNFETLIKLLTKANSENSIMTGFLLLKGYIYLVVGYSPEFEKSILASIRSVFTKCEIEKIESIVIEGLRKLPRKFQTVQLKGFSLPLKKVLPNDFDPIRVLFEGLNEQIEKNVTVLYELLIQKRSKGLATKVKDSFVTLTTKVSDIKMRGQVYKRLVDSKYNVSLCVYTSSEDLELENTLNLFFDRFSLTNGNSLKLEPILKESRYKMVLDIQEVVSLWHLPQKENDKVIVKSDKIIPIPKEVIDIDIQTAKPIGRGFGDQKSSYISIPSEDRFQHTYIIGRTGAGKTKLMQLFLKNDIQESKGAVFFLDPHGDTVKEMLSHVSKDSVDDVIYINFPSSDFVYTFNPLEELDGDSEHLVEGFLEIFKKYFSVDWNSRLEFLLRYILLALRYSDRKTVAEISKILTDPEYRSSLVDSIDDEVVKNFWSIEYPKFADNYYSQAVSPILNKIGQLLLNKKIRRIISSEVSTFNIKKFIKEKKVVLINLSVGELGEWGSSFIGAMIISAITQYSLNQSKERSEERQPIYLYVDEFQNFSTESFIKIFSEARKFRLSLTVAHQYLSQIPLNVIKSVLGNVGSIFCFRLGQSDANILAEEFKPYLEPSDFVQLAGRRFWSKISVNSKVTKPFLGYTVDFVKEGTDYSRTLLNDSVSKYAMLNSEVDKLISGQISLENSKEVNNFPEPVI